MGTYKGNAGHLMQHWTLCELLIAAKRRHTPGLNFIDAHAMAPLATVRKVATNGRFDIVKARVQAGVTNPNSTYESAWQHLKPNEGYPNSAAFVKQVWKGAFSLLLCEKDHLTIQDLKPWLERVRKLERCKCGKLSEGDWRDKFDKCLLSPSAVGLPDGSLTLVSFDPYKYDRNRTYDRSLREPTPGDLYPNDIKLALDAMKSLKGGVLIQLSTYGRGRDDGTPQGAAISSVNSILTEEGFTLAAVVWLNKDMMSLVYARNVSWSAELANLPGRFTEWRNEIDKQLRSSRRQQGLRKGDT